jgi:hypothetical protein
MHLMPLFDGSYVSTGFTLIRRYELMTRDPVKTLASNKQLRKATSLSGALLVWDEHLEFMHDTSYGATSLSEQRERETSGLNEKIYR